MKTIFADFNAMTESDKIRLTSSGSEMDVRQAGAKPGDRVWLSDGEVLVGARLETDPAYGLVGVPAWGTMVHLDGSDAGSIPQVLSELRELLQRLDQSIESEARVFQLLTRLDQIAPPELMAVVPPGYLPLRRARALYFLGQFGMALHEVEVALREQPDDSDLIYFHLELLLREDPDEAVIRAREEAEKPDVTAPALAACIDVFAAASEQVPDQEFSQVGRQILEWTDRFEAAPGRDRVRASVLASVQFNRGLILLRLGQINEAQATIRLAHASDPKEQIFDEASRLDAFDDRARRISARFRERPLLLPTAA